MKNINEHSDVYYMLNAVDAKHSILINEQIGLVGYGLEEEPNMTIVHNVIFDEQLAVLNKDRHVIYGFRGNYFLPVDIDGCIMVNEYVDFIGIILNDDNSYSYILGLKDHVCKNELLEFLYEEPVNQKAMILYKNEKLYVNKFDNSEEIGEVLDDFELEPFGQDCYTLKLNNEIYSSSRINTYNIYNFYKKKLKI